ncbi:hypothetical protein ALP73_200389 [Pseudomonas coronafaciens pv. garcae]|uniref:hypothetical protein n=1 Tax=Pseudomonas syringae group TaxID=136849 RepID=UPI000F3EBCDF|nr:hypothetical protein [Pseudomonas coronafaciens]RMS04941.1 hypothetical protein ALP73_200389 [Pseudomonas coronafaciens pv. garcae]
MLETDEEIKTLNYCVHAIEDLKETKALLEHSAPQSAAILENIIYMLKSSVKFILPNCCSLIDPSDLKQSHLDLVKLPFHCTAFEVPWNSDEQSPEFIGDFKQTLATKRIALCWDTDYDFEPIPSLRSQILDFFPEGGIFLVPLYWGPEQNKWSVTMGGSFLPYGGIARSIGTYQQLPATKIAYAAKKESGHLGKNPLEFKAEPFYLLPELFEASVSYYGDRDKAFGQIILDSHDEMMVLIQACSVINCENIKTYSIPAPIALNKKREKKGKQPFFSYKVLQLLENSGSNVKPGSGGTHANPRMHLRRGHLRRLADKVIWVRPAIINSNSREGVVVKDYSLVKKP